MTTSHSSYKQPSPVMGGSEGNRWDNKQSGKSTHKLGAGQRQATNNQATSSWATNNWVTNNLASQPIYREPGKSQKSNTIINAVVCKSRSAKWVQILQTLTSMANLTQNRCHCSLSLTFFCFCYFFCLSFCSAHLHPPISVCSSKTKRPSTFKTWRMHAQKATQYKFYFGKLVSKQNLNQHQNQII